MTRRGHTQLYLYLCAITLFATINCTRKVKQRDSSPPLPPTLPRFISSLQAKDTTTGNLDTLLYFKRSSCFGFCPTYEYIIYSNGLVHYKGHQHVQLLGNLYGLISEQEWREIMQKVVAIKFFEMSDVYPPEKDMYIPDLPNTVVMVKEFGHRKQIVDNHSCPKELKEFEIFLDAKIKDFSFKEDWNNSEK